MSSRLARALGAFTALLLTLAGIGVAPASSASAGSATINSTGGTGPSDGLRILMGGGQFQVFRDGEPQLYPGDEETPPVDGDSDYNNLFFLAVGEGAETKVIGYRESEGEPWATGRWVASTTGGSTESGSASTVLTYELDGLTYTLKVTADYVRPNQFFTVTTELTIPEGNTKPVRLYHWLDSLLGGSDVGNQFFNASPRFVGVNSPDSPFRVEGVIGDGFTYFAGQFGCPLNDRDDAPPECGAITRGADLTDFVDTTEGLDNGFTYQWPAVTAAGTVTNSAILTFAACLPDEALSNCVIRLAEEATDPDPGPGPAPDPRPTPTPDPTADPVMAKPSFTG